MKLVPILVTVFGFCYSVAGATKDFHHTELSMSSLGGTNIPVTLTTTTATAITRYSQFLQSWTGAGCSGSVLSNYITGASGTFPVSTGTSMIYISTAGGQLCNTGQLTRSFSINNPLTVRTDAGSCTASSGCVTVTCSNSTTVQSVVSTLTLTCP